MFTIGYATKPINTYIEQLLMALTDTAPDLLAGEEAALQLAYQQQCLACAYRRLPA